MSSACVELVWGNAPTLRSEAGCWFEREAIKRLDLKILDVGYLGGGKNWWDNVGGIVR